MAIGLCYPFAMQKARKWYADHVTVDYSGKRPKVIVHPDRDNLDKFKVVHGTTTNKWSGDAKPVFHAWVQMGDMIFDDQTKHTKPNGIDEATYYDVFSAEPKNEYTAKQAIAKCSLKGTEGPWDAKSIAKMKARDAWLGETRMDIKQIIKEELTKYLKEDDEYAVYQQRIEPLWVARDSLEKSNFPAMYPQAWEMVKDAVSEEDAAKMLNALENVDFAAIEASGALYNSIPWDELEAMTQEDDISPWSVAQDLEINQELQEEPGKGPVHVIGSLIHQHGFMNIRKSLEQMGFDVDFVTEPLTMWMLERDGVKYAALDKKHVDDPALTIGKYAIGVMG